MEGIAWREWGDAAFDESRQTGKPVLLDISAVWCHWCHAMEETTYSDPAVIDTINERYIPIRVDSDRNPDINTRYNMGGWPSTVFLTADRDVITGATYVPPDQMVGLLDRLADVYSEEHDDLVNRAGVNRARAEAWFAAAAPRQTEWRDVEKILESVRSAYDPQFGGFGRDQKFPHTSALELLLFNAERTGDQRDLSMVTNTLDAMMRGEVFDHIEGGMFRYATHRNWAEPHYEKLLSDNAQIATLLLDAHRLTEREDFIRLAHKVIFYLEGVLLDQETGAFHGSQDADEEYYKRDVAGRREMEPPLVDSAMYTDSNSRLVSTFVKAYGVAHDYVARDKALRIVSFFNSLPRGDDGTVCHYYENGKAYEYGNLSDSASLTLANLLAYEATGDESYLRFAKELMESMIPAFISGTGGFHDISEARAGERGLTRYSVPLGDNAVVAMCLLKLADLTGDSAYRQSAGEVLSALADQYPSFGIIAADYAIAVALLHSDPVVITTNAEPGTEEADAFIQEALGACGVGCSLKTVSPEQGQPAGAIVCVGSACRAHITDPFALPDEVRSVVSAGKSEGR